MEENRKIVATFILEILGRPPEYLKESLEDIIKKIDASEGVCVLKKTFHEPKLIEEEDQKKVDKEKQLYATFAEVEVEFDKLEHLLGIVFNYMPSNIEVISPESFIFSNSYVGELFTGIMLRLHRYDEIAKKLVNDNTILSSKLQEYTKAFKGKESMGKKSGKKKEKKNKPKKKAPKGVPSKKGKKIRLQFSFLKYPLLLDFVFSF